MRDRSGAASRRRPRRAPGSAAAGAAVLALVAALALGAPGLAPHAPGEMVGAPAQPPGRGLPLGTNTLGQDLLSHLLYGARTSLLVGFVAAALSTGLSAAAGLVAGLWRGGRGLLLGLIDLFLAVPGVPLVVLIVVFMGPGFWPLVLALAFVGWAGFARVVAAQVRACDGEAYVEAARALGATTGRIVRTGILPAVTPILFTKFLLTVRWALLLEAALGLLGLGDPARASWGQTLHQAFGFPLLLVTDAWVWWAGPPAAAIVLTSLGLMAIGQDLDYWLNPRARTGG